MSLFDIAGRTLTGLPFVKLGYAAATAPGPRVDMAKPVLDPLRKVVPIPVDDEMVVRANGAAQAVGGALLAAGVLPRAAALGLIASLVPTTLAGHAFWTSDDPAVRGQQQVQFLKNVTMIGGLTAIAATSRK